MEFFHPNPKTIEEDLKLENLRKLQQLLLAYYVYDPDLEYVQGMADLLAPLLYVLHDETETFWAFVYLMKRQRSDFLQNGRSIELKMKKIKELLRLLDPQFYDFFGFNNETAQLFFCYRWLLVLFKREFNFHDTLLVWDTILSSECGDYEVYIAVAILILAKEDILQRCEGFGETLAFLSEMTHSKRVGVFLDKADQIYRLFKANTKLNWLYMNAITY